MASDLDRQRRVNQILLGAFAVPEAERSSWLEEACADATNLFDEVQELLANDHDLTGFLELPAGEALLRQPPTTLAPPCAEIGGTIGQYRLLEVLGEGGMGTVYLAEQEKPIHRRVAVKLLRPGFLHHDGILRFRAEGQALARMSHPNIAQVFEAGTAESGQPYIVMEHVAGMPIHAFCDHHRATLNDRLSLFIRVCDGIQHAHQQGILHRDIKPSNILVMGEADKPILKIIDFGIAKALDQPLIELTSPLADGLTGDRVIGTPAYLSPEAISGQAVDTRSDVYALGILLYQLLVGVLPFPANGSTLLEVLQILRGREDLPKPSERFASLGGEEAERLAAQRGSRATTLRRHLRADLDWIILKATARDRAKRYASVAMLADDIARYERHETILAGPPTLTYRFSRFARRHKVSLVAGILVLLAVLAGLLGMTIEARRAHREAEIARQTLDFMTGLFELSDPAKAQGITARELLARGAEKIRQDPVMDAFNRARLMDTIGMVHMSLGLYQEAESLLDEALELRRRLLGASHPDVASSLAHRGVLYRLQGRFDDAETVLREALAIQEKTLGEEHIDIGLTLRQLGAIEILLGHYAESLPLLERSLEVQRQASGSDPSDVALSLDALGRSHMMLGAYHTAEQLAQHSLTLRQEALPESHPHLALSFSLLGNIYHAWGDYARAEHYLIRALDAQQELLGEDHPIVAEHLLNLGPVYRALKRYAEAEALYRRALEIKEAVHGANHPVIAVILNNLGVNYWYQERYADAEPYYHRAQRIRELTLDAGHPDVARSFNNLGEVYWKLGRYDEAEPLLHRALTLWEGSLGEEHPDLAYPLHALAMIHCDRQRFDKAEALLRRALSLREKALDPAHPDLLESRRELAALLARTDHNLTVTPAVEVEPTS